MCWPGIVAVRANKRLGVGPRGGRIAAIVARNMAGCGGASKPCGDENDWPRPTDRPTIPSQSCARAIRSKPLGKIFLATVLGVTNVSSGRSAAR